MVVAPETKKNTDNEMFVAQCWAVIGTSTFTALAVTSSSKHTVTMTTCTSSHTHTSCTLVTDCVFEHK